MEKVYILQKACGFSRWIYNLFKIKSMASSTLLLALSINMKRIFMMLCEWQYCWPTIDLYHGAGLLDCFPIDINGTKLRLAEQNSLDPIRKMIISIHYCYWIRGTWPKWSQHGEVLFILWCKGDRSQFIQVFGVCLPSVNG